MELSERHKALLRHMLGIKAGGGTPYRNCFVAGEGHTDMPVLNELLASGYVFVRDNPGGSGYLYRATDKGRDAVHGSQRQAGPEGANGNKR
jgi:hypothetical protein